MAMCCLVCYASLYVNLWCAAWAVLTVTYHANSPACVLTSLSISEQKMLCYCCSRAGSGCAPPDQGCCWRLWRSPPLHSASLPSASAVHCLASHQLIPDHAGTSAYALVGLLFNTPHPKRSAPDHKGSSLVPHVKQL